MYPPSNFEVCLSIHAYHTCGVSTHDTKTNLQPTLGEMLRKIISAQQIKISCCND